MNLERFFGTDLKKMHHTCLIEAPLSAGILSVYEYLRAREYQTKGNPDFFHRVFKVLKIDDVHELQRVQRGKALVSDQKIILIETIGITEEAQNAFLKVLEEPTAGTHFVIVTHSTSRLLPTLLSRVLLVSLPKSATVQNEEFVDFHTLPLKEQMKRVGSIADTKDKQVAFELVDSFVVATKILSGADSSVQKYQKQLLESRGFLMDRSPSVKTILENVVLTFPREKK